MHRLIYAFAIVLTLNTSAACADDVTGTDLVTATVDCTECLSDTPRGHLFANVEAVFLRYFRADGLRLASAKVSNSDARVTFDFEVSPRVTVGYQGCDGLGVRIRWWTYDHSAVPSRANEFIRVDTYTIDLELYDVIQLTCASELEVNAGIRYHDFEEYLRNGQLLKTSLTGMGVTGGAEIRRTMLGGGWVYAKGRGGILLGDRTVDDTDANPTDLYELNDTVPSFLELGLGYEIERCLTSDKVVKLSAGVELQKWFDVTEGVAIDLGGLVGIDPNTGLPNAGDFGAETFAGATAVGFAGFVFGAELSY